MMRLMCTILCTSLTSAVVRSRDLERVEGLAENRGIEAKYFYPVTSRGQRRIDEDEDSVEARFFLQEKLCSLGLAECDDSVRIKYVQPVQVVPVGQPVPEGHVGDQPHIPAQVVGANYHQSHGSSYQSSLDEYSAPGQYSSSYNAPKPTYDAPKPSYYPSKPSYDPPKTSFTSPRPVYKPSYDLPQKTENVPKPTYDAPKPSYNAPKPSYSAPNPSYNAPVYKPKPSYEPPTIIDAKTSGAQLHGSSSQYQTKYSSNQYQTQHQYSTSQHEHNSNHQNQYNANQIITQKSGDVADYSSSHYTTNFGAKKPASPAAAGSSYYPTENAATETEQQQHHADCVCVPVGQCPSGGIFNPVLLGLNKGKDYSSLINPRRQPASQSITSTKRFRSRSRALKFADDESKEENSTEQSDETTTEGSGTVEDITNDSVSAVSSTEQNVSNEELVEELAIDLDDDEMEKDQGLGNEKEEDKSKVNFHRRKRNAFRAGRLENVYVPEDDEATTEQSKEDNLEEDVTVIEEVEEEDDNEEVTVEGRGEVTEAPYSIESRDTDIDIVADLKQRLKEERKKERIRNRRKNKNKKSKPSSGDEADPPQESEVEEYDDEDFDDKSFDSLSSFTEDVSDKVGNVGSSVSSGVERIFDGISNILGTSTATGQLQPTVGFSFGLPQGGPGYGGYPTNPVNTGGAVNPYYTAQNGLELGPVNLNPLVSLQAGTTDTGDLALKPLVNLHLTPNGCGILGCDKDFNEYGEPTLKKTISDALKSPLEALKNPFGIFNKDEKHTISAEYTAPGYQQPGTGYGVPSTGYGVPSTGYGVPGSEYGAPGSGYGVPSYQTGFGSSSGSVQSGYGSSSGSSQSSFGSSSGSAQSGYGFSSVDSSYGAPKPSYNQPSDEYGAPSFNTPNTDYLVPSAGYNPSVASGHSTGHNSGQHAGHSTGHSSGHHSSAGHSSGHHSSAGHSSGHHSSSGHTFGHDASQTAGSAGGAATVNVHHHYHHVDNQYNQKSSSNQASYQTNSNVGYQTNNQVGYQTSNYLREDPFARRNSTDLAGDEVFKRETMIPNSSGFLPSNLPSSGGSVQVNSGSAKVSVQGAGGGFKFPNSRKIDADQQRRKRQPVVGGHADREPHSLEVNDESILAIANQLSGQGKVKVAAPTCGAPGSGYVCCRIR